MRVDRLCEVREVLAPRFVPDPWPIARPDFLLEVLSECSGCLLAFVPRIEDGVTVLAGLEPDIDDRQGFDTLPQEAHRNSRR